MRFDRRMQALAALLALGAAAAGGVAVGLLGTAGYEGRYVVPAQHREPQVAPPPPAAVVVQQPAAPPPVATPPPPSPAADPPDEDDDSDRIAGAIARATRKALDRGEPVRWHKAGRQGYVVVSDAQDYPDRVCRSVFATIIDDRGETRSAPHLWCADGDDDEWEPVR